MKEKLFSEIMHLSSYRRKSNEIRNKSEDEYAKKKKNESYMYERNY